MHPFDLDQHDSVPPSTRGRRPDLGRVVGPRSDLQTMFRQHAADRLDPEPDPDLVDEGHYQGSRGSRFPAKNEEAASRISFAPGKRTRRKADTAPRVDLTSASTLSTRSAAGFARYLDVGS